MVWRLDIFDIDILIWWVTITWISISVLRYFWYFWLVFRYGIRSHFWENRHVKLSRSWENIWFKLFDYSIFQLIYCVATISPYGKWRFSVKSITLKLNPHYSLLSVNRCILMMPMYQKLEILINISLLTCTQVHVCIAVQWHVSVSGW